MIVLIAVLVVLGGSILLFRTRCENWSLTQGAFVWWRRVKPWVFASVRTAPATYLYLFAMCVVTWVLLTSETAVDRQLLLSHSTNLTQLKSQPVAALITSAFYVSNPWLIAAWLIAFPLIVASAERWLGTLRLVTVFVVGHVLATVLRALAIEYLSKRGHVASSADQIDVGASYGLACVVGVVTYRLRRPWNWWWIAGWISVTVVVTGVARSAPLGHLLAVLVGLACFPLTRAAVVRRRRDEPMWGPPVWAVASSRRSIGDAEMPRDD